jgi:hypothetical protein
MACAIRPNTVKQMDTRQSLPLSQTLAPQTLAPFPKLGMALAILSLEKSSQLKTNMKITWQEKKHGWWIETKATVPCKVSQDGQVVVFDLADVQASLDAEYPHDDKVWWFNEIKDREVAERRGKEVFANPQVLWRHFLPPIICKSP